MKERAKRIVIIVIFVIALLLILINRCEKSNEKPKDINKCTVNCDIDGDGKPDINLDIDKDGKADINVDTNDDDKVDKNLLNKDIDNDGICDLNCDTNNDGWPDTNIDLDNDNKCDLKCEDENDDKEDDKKEDNDNNINETPNKPINYDINKTLRATFHYGVEKDFNEITVCNSKNNNSCNVTPPTIKDEGYKFVTWLYENKPINSYSINKDTEYRAKYSRTIALSYDVNDSNANIPDETFEQELITGLVPTSKEIKLNDSITRVGYNFINWNIDGRTYNKGSNYQLKSNVTATANWEPITYKITYNLDNGTVNNPNSYTIETEDITLNNPTKEGYEFIGWTGSNGSTEELNVTIKKGSIGDKEYTANYKKIHTITLNANGGVLDNNTINALDNEKIGNIPTPTYNEGYELEGWYLNNKKIDNNYVVT